MVEVEAEDDVHHSNTSRQTDLGDGVERERRGGRKWDEGINGLPGIDGGGRMSAGRGAERGNRKGKKGIGDDHEDEAGSSNRKKEFSRVGGKMFGLGNSEEEVAPGRSQKLDYSGSTHGLGAGKDYTEASFRGGHDSGNRLKDIRQIATQHMLDLDMQRLGEASGKESDSRRNDFRDGAGGEVIEAMGEKARTWMERQQRGDSVFWRHFDKSVSGTTYRAACYSGEDSSFKHRCFGIFWSGPCSSR